MENARSLLKIIKDHRSTMIKISQKSESRGEDPLRTKIHQMHKPLSKLHQSFWKCSRSTSKAIKKEDIKSRAAHRDRRQEGCKPFAELWMGDHPSGPARVESPSQKAKKSPKLGISMYTISMIFYDRRVIVSFFFLIVLWSMVLRILQGLLEVLFFFGVCFVDFLLGCKVMFSWACCDQRNTAGHERDVCICTCMC